MLKLDRHKAKEVIFLLFISLTPLLWLSGNEVVLGHDSGFRLDVISYFKTLFYSWNPIHGFGADWSLNKGFLLAQLPENFFSILLGSVSLGQRLAFFFWFFAIGISMYTLVNSFFPQKRFWIFRLFSSTLYVFNFFLLQGWFIAERAKFSIFVALPLIFLVLYKALDGSYKLSKAAMMFAIFLFFFNGGGSPPLYGPIILIFTVTFLYLTFLNYLKTGKKALVYSLKVGTAFVSSFLLANAYWIVPQIEFVRQRYGEALTSVGGIQGVLDWERVVNKETSFINLFRLQGMPDWYSEGHLYSKVFLESPLLIFGSLLFTGILLFGLLLYKRTQKKDRNTKLLYLLLLCFLIGLVFAAGSHPPLGFIYVLLIKYIPGFAIFRSAFFKFAPAFFFSFILLVGYALNIIVLKFYKKRLWFNFFGILSLMFVLFYHFPFFKGDFFDWNKPFSTKVAVPEYVYEMSNHIDKSVPEDSRVLLLPPLDDLFHADSYSWGFWSLDVLPRLSTDRSIVTNDTSFPSIVSEIYKAIEEKDNGRFTVLTRTSGIGAVLWRDDILYNDKTKGSTDVSVLEENLKSFDEITLDGYSGGPWRLYKLEDDNFQSRVFFPKDIVFTNSDIGVTGEVLKTKGKISTTFTDIPTGEIGQKIKSLASELVIEADCIFCSPGQFNRLVGEVGLPKTTFLPGSVFYSLIKNGEEILFLNNKGSAEERIDFQISLASKRVAEIQKMLTNLPAESLNSMVEENVDRYESHIGDAVVQLDSLSGAQRNFYTARIITFLEAHQRIWVVFDQLERAEKKHFSKFSDFIKETIKDLEKDAWFTKCSSNRKLVADIPEAGIYDLQVLGIRPKAFFVDGSRVPFSGKTYLNRGIHFLEVVYGGSCDPWGEEEKIDSRVFLISSLKGEIETPDSVSFQRVTPTRFSANIKNAKGSFILAFGDQFNEGWKAYINGESLDDHDHFRLNGYANAWLVDHPGDFQVEIVFWPHEYFKYSFFVSLTSVSVFLFLIGRNYTKNKK